RPEHTGRYSDRPAAFRLITNRRRRRIRLRSRACRRSLLLPGSRLSEQKGNYRIAIFTALTLLRAGPVDISILIQNTASRRIANVSSVNSAPSRDSCKLFGATFVDGVFLSCASSVDIAMPMNVNAANSRENRTGDLDMVFPFEGVLRTRLERLFSCVILS